MICDIGGGTSEISVISLKGMVVTSAIRVGGDEFDEAIIKHIRNAHNLIIGEQTAERLKIEIGNASPDKVIEKVEIKGTDAITGLPRRLEIDSVEVREALQEPINQIVEEIKENAGTDAAGTGRGYRGTRHRHGRRRQSSQGPAEAHRQGDRRPVILAERPLECVAIGAGKYFETMKSKDGSLYGSLNI